MKSLLALFCFLSLDCHANSLAVSFGPSLDGTIGVEKALQLGYEVQYGSPSLVIETGEWVTNGQMVFFGGANIGIHVVTLDGFSMRVGVGPSAISQTDDRLSSTFEFHIQAKLGLQLGNFSTGVQFDHFSNAGITPPNLGRDLAALYIGFPL